MKVLAVVGVVSLTVRAQWLVRGSGQYKCFLSACPLTDVTRVPVSLVRSA